MQTARKAANPWREPSLWIMLLLVSAIYFSRMTLLPPCGEETRVARMAVLMIETGDWVVPRQQNVPFPERPPLGAWAMAGMGLARGSVDRVAMRFPGALAVVLTSLVIYLYARSFLGRLGALSAGLAYATFGQVLQIGRQGESEPLFALFVGASLLLWHLGYMQRWPKAWMWIAGYTLAGLGALVKGPQAPVYFGAAVGTYLLLRRDWRTLFCWSHLAGMAAFAGVVGAWLVPFALAADGGAVTDIWTILARKRFGTGGLAKHLVSYPLETLICLLPWSPLLLHLTWRRFRESLGELRPYVVFLVTAVAVTYPSVWFAAGARGRYYMPLYPIIAVLVGIVVERSALATRSEAVRRGWGRFVVVLAALSAIAGLAVAGASLLPLPLPAEYIQPVTWAVVFVAAAAVTSCLLIWSLRTAESCRAQVAVIALCAFLGVVYTGIVLNVRQSTARDMAADVAAAKRRLPDPGKLVSLGPIAHQFAYYYQSLIREAPWPLEANDLDAAVEYFCFRQGPDDTDEVRVAGRGMYSYTTPAKLPFAWEEIARVRYGRQGDDKRVVIIGRRLGAPRVTRRP